MQQPHEPQFPPPVIALLTDFGSSDHYVGVVKGVIASISPSARVVDISHEVKPHNAWEASYLLWASYKFFPGNSIFTSIIDPGVGSARKILIARTDKYFFLAPDNGVLDLVCAEDSFEECHEVKTKGSPFVLAPVSSTFQGRDVFAPVAAYLANGVAAAEFGPKHAVPRVGSPFIRSKRQRIGLVLHCDRFGNIVTNIRNELFESLADVRIRKTTVSEKIRFYWEGKANTLCLIQGSSGLVEIVMKEKNASRRVKAQPGGPLEIEWQ